MSANGPEIRPSPDFLELARRIASRLAFAQGLRAFAVGGAIARGRADRYSDLELTCYWDDPQDEPTREVWLSRLNVDRCVQSTIDRAEIWRGSDSFEFDGVGVDITHRTVELVEAAIAAVVDQFDPDLSKSRLVQVVECLVPLAGESLIETWRARIASYPTELQRRFLETHLEFPPRGRMELHRLRRDLFVFHEGLIEYRARIFLALLGINRQYVPGCKRMELTLESLAIQPDNLTARFRSTFAGEDVDRAWAMTCGLIEDVFDLVERHVPEVNTEKARKTFDTIERMAVRRACFT